MSERLQSTEDSVISSRNVFQADLRDLYPLSVIDTSMQRVGPDTQEATFVFAPAATSDLLSHAVRVMDAGVVESRGGKSSRIGFFRSNLSGEKIMTVIEMWKKANPGEAFPQSNSGYELAQLYFPDDSKAEDAYWDTAKETLARYRQLLGEAGGDHRTAYKRLVFEHARDYPYQLPKDIDVSEQMT